MSARRCALCGHVLAHHWTRYKCDEGNYFRATWCPCRGFELAEPDKLRLTLAEWRTLSAMRLKGSGDPAVLGKGARWAYPERLVMLGLARFLADGEKRIELTARGRAMLATKPACQFCGRTLGRAARSA